MTSDEFIPKFRKFLPSLFLIVLLAGGALWLLLPSQRGTLQLDAAGFVSWKSNGPARLYMNADWGREVMLAEADQGSFQPAWLAPGHTYNFTLRTAVEGKRTPEKLLDSASLKKDSLTKAEVLRPGLTSETLWMIAFLAAVIVLAVTLSLWPAARQRLSSFRVGSFDLYLGCVIAAEIALFSLPFKLYFFGDSITQLYQRPTTLGEALTAFTQIKLWYRPLSQDFICYLLYPIFKATFAWYHGLTLLLHVVVTCLVYFALVKLVEDKLIASAATLFFGIHAINFYTTYDTAFFAETSVAICYLLAVWAFFNRRIVLACVAFVLGLLSKEAAVTVPLAIAALVAAVPALRAEWKTWGKRSIPLLVILTAYLAFYSTKFTVGASGLTSSTRSDYAVEFNRTALENLARYLHWTFQIPDGWVTAAWIDSSPFLPIAYLFAFLVAGFIVFSFVRGGNRNASIALIWFAATALPVIALNRHLLHHLYLPLIGLTLLVAEFFVFAKKRLPRSAFLVVLMLLLANHTWLAVRDVKSDMLFSWVADSATKAKATARFVRGHRSLFAKASAVYVVNDTGDELLPFSMINGKIFAFLTGSPGLEGHMVRKSSEVPSDLPADALVLRFGDASLSDVTAAIRTPAPATPPAPPEKLTASLRLNESGQLQWDANGPVILLVAVEDGPEKFMADLHNGKTEMDWLVPGTPFVFKLRTVANGVPGPVLAAVSYKATVMGGQPAIEQMPPARADSADAPMETIRMTPDGVVIWRARDLSQILLSSDGSPDRLFAQGAYGEERPNWLQANHVYRFKLRSLYGGKAGPVLDAVEYRRDSSGRVYINKVDPDPTPAWWPVLLAVAVVGTLGMMAFLFFRRRRRLAPGVAAAQ